MTDLALQRLYYQHLTPPLSKSPVAIVRHLLAVQAQDFGASNYAIGVRGDGLKLADITNAINERQIVRTWAMRGTIQFVAAEDTRWMLKLTEPIIRARFGPRHRELEIEDSDIAQVEKLIVKALEERGAVMRKDLFALLEENGIPTGDYRGMHLLYPAALKGLICHGPMEGKQPTFVLMDDWVKNSRSLENDEALAEFALRYFVSHGPATLKDFTWWSGLRAGDARAGLEAVKSRLVSETVDDVTYWRSPETIPNDVQYDPLYLLPAFDEYLIGYTDRGASADKAHERKLWTKNGIFNPIIVINGKVVGTWKREIKPKKIIISKDTFAPLTARQEEQFVEVAARYGKFYDLPVEMK